MILIFLMEKIKIKIKFIGGDQQDQDQFYKFTGSDQDHQKDHDLDLDLDLFHHDQLILNNPVVGLVLVGGTWPGDGPALEGSVPFLFSSRPSILDLALLKQLSIELGRHN